MTSWPHMRDGQRPGFLSNTAVIEPVKMELCNGCNGSGWVDEVVWIADQMHIETKPCGACGGTGRA